ncbi:MAG: hypothetical protein IPK87_15780 [Planctomycetes bacterium]|nr:hypothetical protein [Planctomycetota bacterium]
MNTMLRFGLCLLLVAALAPAPVSLANENESARPDQSEEPAKPSVHQFSDAELSTAHETLAALSAEQGALLNHLRYLLQPQYEEELMTGRAFAPCPLPPFEQPGAALESPDVLRLWAVLASGMPITDSTRTWLQLFVQAPIPADSESISEIGLHMAVCAHGMRRAELGLTDKLTKRANELIDAAQEATRVTGKNSHLIDGRFIDPEWFASQLWRSLIYRFALEMNLKIQESAWENALRNLISAGDKKNGWTSKSRENSEAEDLDANLFAIAALSLAATAPEGVLNKGLARNIEQRLQDAPGVLKRLGSDYAGEVRAGTRLAMMLTFAPDLAPEGSNPDTWRKSMVQFAIKQDPSGMVLDGGDGGRELALPSGRRYLTVNETALQCVALSGGLLGDAAPLADMSLADVGRAMHACSVLHASTLPEGARRTFAGGGGGRGHDLPKPGVMESFMVEGIDYLIQSQHKDGGWGSAYTTRGAQPAASFDPGSTAFVAMALMRAGHTPFKGKHKDAVLKATKYLVDVVEKATEDGPRITDVTGTQLQGKLGQIVDTAVVTQFLARVLQAVETDRKLYNRVEAALDKCICKIEAAQAEDGGWITAGWAPVLQSAMFNQALELAELAGREVDPAVLSRSRDYLSHDVDVEGGKTGAAKRPTSAGVAFYAGASALRATAADSAEVELVMERAIKDRVLPAKAEVSDTNLRKIGYSEEAAAAKVKAYRAHETLVAKLNDEAYLRGFGNNGGEEFICYMLSSESIVITGHDTWDTWNKKLRDTFEKIQNADGSWSGHHCISSPVLCTAAVMLCLTADREVHVLVETGPSTRSTSSKKTEKKPEPKSEGPVTGKK